MKVRALGLAVLAAATLAACGGGDDTSSGSTASLSAYAGTWRGTCKVDSEIKNASNQSMYAQETTTLVPNGNNLNATLVTKVYQATDTGCTGAAAATHTQTGTFTLVSASNVTLNGASLAGHKVNINFNKIGGLSSGGTITLNGVVYPGDYFQTAINITNLYIAISGNKIFGGESTALETDPVSTKVQ